MISFYTLDNLRSSFSKSNLIDDLLSSVDDQNDKNLLQQILYRNQEPTIEDLKYFYKYSRGSVPLPLYILKASNTSKLFSNLSDKTPLKPSLDNDVLDIEKIRKPMSPNDAISLMPVIAAYQLSKIIPAVKMLKQVGILNNPHAKGFVKSVLKAAPLAATTFNWDNLANNGFDLAKFTSTFSIADMAKPITELTGSLISSQINYRANISAENEKYINNAVAGFIASAVSSYTSKNGLLLSIAGGALGASAGILSTKLSSNDVDNKIMIKSMSDFTKNYSLTSAIYSSIQQNFYNMGWELTDGKLDFDQGKLSYFPKTIISKKFGQEAKEYVPFILGVILKGMNDFLNTATIPENKQMCSAMIGTHHQYFNQTLMDVENFSYTPPKEELNNQLFQNVAIIVLAGMAAYVVNGIRRCVTQAKKSNSQPTENITKPEAAPTSDDKPKSFVNKSPKSTKPKSFVDKSPKSTKPKSFVEKSAERNVDNALHNKSK